MPPLITMVTARSSLGDMTSSLWCLLVSMSLSLKRNSSSPLYLSSVLSLFSSVQHWTLKLTPLLISFSHVLIQKKTVKKINSNVSSVCVSPSLFWNKDTNKKKSVVESVALDSSHRKLIWIWKELSQKFFVQ